MINSTIEDLLYSRLQLPITNSQQQPITKFPIIARMFTKPSSVPTYSMKIPTQSKDVLSNYVCSWIKDDKIKEDILTRIKYKKDQGIYDKNKIVNQHTLSQEYFKIWMEQPPSKPLLRLAMHPLLTVQDQKTIDQLSNTERNDQIKLSLQLTGGTVAFYWIFLSRMAKFQRFFNDRNKNPFANGFKKVFAVYAVLIAWQSSLTSHYEKTLPQKIHEIGMFKKYGIQFEDKNV